jgi:hypothetical protein
MRETLFFIFFSTYYLLWGVISYCYFRFYKKDKTENMKLYIFFYGMRIRIAISGLFAILTVHLWLYGAIQIVSNK